MTSALGLKLQEAIEAAEARKAMAEWTALNTPTLTPMTTITPDTSVSICEASFNMVRDNPGKTKPQIVDLLATQGHKSTSTTSMIAMMIRYGIIIQEEGKVLRAIGTKYKPRTAFNPRLKQRLGPKPKNRKVTEERLKVVMVKKGKPEMEAPKFGDNIGGLVLTDMGGGMARFVKPPESDPVNSPAHYTVGNIETIDYIQAKLTPEEFKGYLKGNVLKYASRAGHKGNAMEDAGKLAWYANRLAEQS
jgi:hypothetical protein